MYIHPAFEIGTSEALDLLRERAFGLFVLATADAPFGVHVPFLVDRTLDDRLHVEFHVARVNPVHSHIGEGTKALLACQGPDAYISPDWYNVENQVPTWNYVSVHLKGPVRVLPQADNLGHVDRLSAFFEQRLAPKPPWNSAKMDDKRRDAMTRAIVTIAMDVETVEAQRKLIQHKGETEHRGAVEGLRGRADHSSVAIADLIEQAARDKFRND